MNAQQAEVQEFYLEVGEKVLSELSGFTKRQINAWMKTRCGDWDKGYHSYVHQRPEFWVIDALISDRVANKIGGAETAKLRHDILHAIEKGNPKWPRNRAYDWAAARRRIKRVFSAYGVPDGYVGRRHRKSWVDEYK
jgi:hypothetical protein